MFIDGALLLRAAHTKKVSSLARMVVAATKLEEKKKMSHKIRKTYKKERMNHFPGLQNESSLFVLLLASICIYRNKKKTQFLILETNTAIFISL